MGECVSSDITGKGEEYLLLAIAGKGEEEYLLPDITGKGEKEYLLPDITGKGEEEYLLPDIMGKGEENLLPQYYSVYSDFIASTIVTV